MCQLQILQNNFYIQIPFYSWNIYNKLTYYWRRNYYSTSLNKDWYGFGSLNFNLKIISDKYTKNFKYKVIAIPFKIRQKTSKPKTHKPNYYQISVQDNKNHCWIHTLFSQRTYSLTEILLYCNHPNLKEQHEIPDFSILGTVNVKSRWKM